MKIINFGKLLLINFIILIIGIFVIELIFGNWFNNRNFGNLLLNINKHRIITKLPYYTTNPVVYTTDINGFRANNYNLNEVDILIVGGSTTEQKMLDDNFIWSKILDNNLNSFNYNKILNAGIGGQTSFGHVKIYDIWLSRFEKLRPKLTFFYIGINDSLFMYENIKNKNNYIKGRVMNSTNRDTLKIENNFDNFIQFLKNNSAVIFFLKIIKGNYLSFKYNFGYFDAPIKFETKYDTIKTKQLSYNQKKIKDYLNQYSFNLLSLVKLSNDRDSIPIFITQSIAKNHWINDYLNIINNETLKFCDLQNQLCFDLANEIVLNNDDFYDGIHVTPAGSKKIALYIKSKLESLTLD